MNDRGRSTTRRSTFTYDANRDETTVWVWAKTSRVMREIEGVSHAWKALFRIRGRAVPRV